MNSKPKKSSSIMIDFGRSAKTVMLACFVILTGTLTTFAQQNYDTAQEMIREIEKKTGRKVTREQLESLQDSVAQSTSIPQSMIERARKTAGKDSSQAVPPAMTDDSPEDSAEQTAREENTAEIVGREDVAADTTAVIEAEVDSTFYGEGRFAGMKYFGYDVFSAPEGSMGPIETGPVDPGYPIGAGDVIRLTLWGEVEFQNELTVDRNGNIVIPKAGQVFVAGTRLDALRESLKNNLSRFYSGLAKDPPTIFMDVTLARLRSNQVFLMGEVKRPGAYTVSSYATAFNAMYAIGGPAITGSLRDVRIMREDSVVTHVDLYDYMLKGASTDDQRLQNGDIVFVAPRKLTVAIKGEVLRPGIYEVLDQEDLADLFSFAGGLNPTAYSFRAQIDRIVSAKNRVRGDEEREVIDVDINSVMSGELRVKLEDGDIVEVFPIRDMLKNYVEVFGGGVLRPGRYELNDKLRSVSDLIAMADGLADDAYTKRADLVRTRDDLTTEFIAVDLAKALAHDPAHDIVLQRWDIVKVYSTLDIKGIPKVSIDGYVKMPGDYLLHENMTVYDLVFAYSGLQDSLRYSRTFFDRADIHRLNDDGLTRTLISFNLGDVWNQVPGSDILLEREDRVVLYSKDVYELSTWKVNIDGSVKNPGTYDLDRNMTLADILIKCGGFTENAWFINAEIARLPQSGIPGDSLSYILHVPVLDTDAIPDDPETAVRMMLAGDSPAKSFKLQPNDQVFIRPNPDYSPAQTVNITGEVNFPGTYVLNKNNEMLSELILRAGGLKSTAYAGGGQLFRNDTQLFVDFEKLINKNDNDHDVVLLPGDHIVIPPYPNTVLITGEVMNPGMYKYVKGLRISDYFKMSGGKTENGGSVYYTFPSGRTNRLRFMHNPKIQDGTVIRVVSKEIEEQKEKTDWAGVIKETTAILSSVMMVIYLSKQID